MKTNDIAFLRTHSYFSFLESMLSPQGLVETAQTNGIHALGLTDRHYLTGAIEFYEACVSAGIKPILGLEINIAFQGHTGLLVLLAKDRKGWSNLSKLSTQMLVDGLDLKLSTINHYQEGLLCISGGYQCILRELILNSPPIYNQPAQLLYELKSIFQQDFYIEVQRYASGPLQSEPTLISLAHQFAIPIIATQNIHYQTPQDQPLYNTLMAIKHNIPINQLSTSQLPPEPASFPSQEDFAHRYNQLPQALKNLQHIVDSCNLELPLGKTHYPNFPTPGGMSQADYLRAQAFAGAKNIYQHLTQQIKDRLDYELSIIIEMGYEPIFLIMEDVLNHARELGIPTSSRGSAASSLVAHCLNITTPDPLALNLYFERFLNPARKKPPDIDTDIASHRRDEIIQYVFEKYHPEKVAMVGTINRYRPKSAFTDVAKAHGLSTETIRQLSKKLPHSYHHGSESDESNPFAPLLRDAAIPLIKDIVIHAQAILDLPRHLSVHPGGIIIAPVPITDLIPLTHSASLDINHAQFDLTGIEKFGLVKIDLLGIRGLTVLGEVADQIQSWHQSEYKNGLDVLEQIPCIDSQTAKTVLNAQTIGCFQIESPGMRATLREIKAQSVEDVMAALALYRPGPLRGGLRDAFVRRFRGEEEVTHIHESLTDLLSDTLGVILYQEQVLRIAHDLGGLSIAHADILRRAMSHFDPGGIMLNLRNNFIEGAANRHQVPAETAVRIWDMMAAFAGYGFPKAHAASYAQLAWNSAWCKTHYPAEFMCAVLGFGGGYYSPRVYLMEARRLGLTVKPPHINHASIHFRVCYPKGQSIIYTGLNQVRDLTHKTITNIINKRPFHSLEDFLVRVDPHQKEARHLLMCGALEGIIPISLGLEYIQHKRPPRQLNLFSNKAIAEDWDIEQKIKAQLGILGFSLEMSQLEQFSDQIQSLGAISTLEAENAIDQRVRVAGMRQAFRRIRNSGNESIGFLTIEDLEGNLSIQISASLYRKNFILLREQGPFLIEGVIQKDTQRDEIRMKAEKIMLINSTSQ